MPDLLDLQDVKERADKRAQLPLPKGEDHKSGSRPFEGSKAAVLEAASQRNPTRGSPARGILCYGVIELKTRLTTSAISFRSV